MPQPLSSAAPGASIHIGNSDDSPSNHNPALALLAMRVVAEWSLLESFVTSLFIETLGTNAVPSAAMFATIRSQQGQRDAIRAVATVNIQDQAKRDLVLAALGVYEGASKTRNRIAHWVWGHSPDISDGVLLGDPIAVAALNAAVKDYLAGRLYASGPDVPVIDKQRVYVYREQDFREASARIQRAMDLVSRVRLVLSRPAQMGPADQELLQLSNEPEIRRELDRLNRDRQSDR